MSRATPSPRMRASPRAVTRRALGVTLAVTLAPRRAHAYGLGKPPADAATRRQNYETSLEARKRAAETRDARERAESEDAPTTTLPSGLRYREYATGSEGPAARVGSRVEFRYKVYRLSSGAYFKYSSGGTPVLLWARGYGSEGRDDVGDFVDCVLGTTPLPRAVAPCVVGMRRGGVRRILVPPNLGWTDENVFPRPDSFGAARRLENYKDGPLLFEIEVVRVRDAGEESSSLQRDVAALEPEGDNSFSLPAPPRLSASKI